jgi:tetratricopeptide (TPR) repeat protein
VTSEAAIRSRVDAGHALLLLGELDKARVCLECALAFDARRAGAASEQSRGRIFGLLARVYTEIGDGDQARAAGRRAVQILGRDAPASSHYRQAASLLRELHAVKAGGP